MINITKQVINLRIWVGSGRIELTLHIPQLLFRHFALWVEDVFFDGALPPGVHGQVDLPQPAVLSFLAHMHI